MESNPLVRSQVLETKAPEQIIDIMDDTPQWNLRSPRLADSYIILVSLLQIRHI